MAKIDLTTIKDYEDFKAKSGLRGREAIEYLFNELDRVQGGCNPVR